MKLTKGALARATKQAEVQAPPLEGEIPGLGAVETHRIDKMRQIEEFERDVEERLRSILLNVPVVSRDGADPRSSLANRVVRIHKSFQDAKEAFFLIGKELYDIHNLGKDVYDAIVKAEGLLPFGEKQAIKYRLIAEAVVRGHYTLDEMPHGMRSAYALATLNEPQRKEARRLGIVRATVQAEDVVRFKKDFNSGRVGTEVPPGPDLPEHFGLVTLRALQRRLETEVDSIEDSLEKLKKTLEEKRATLEKVRSEISALEERDHRIHDVIAPADSPLTFHEEGDRFGQIRQEAQTPGAPATTGVDKAA
jgi:hypothetical protein